MNKVKDLYYDVLLKIGDWLEDVSWSHFKEPATMYFRDYCPFCGVEGGYGHRLGCENATRLVKTKEGYKVNKK